MIEKSIQKKILEKRVFSMRNLDISQEKIREVEKEIEKIEREIEENERYENTMSTLLQHKRNR